MKRSFKLSLLAGALALCGIAGFAIAQTISVPTVPQVNSTADYVQVIQGGRGQAQSLYATAAQLTSVSGYKDLGTISTDPAYTATTGVWNVFGHSTGTVTAVTITTPASPGDGQRLCYYNDHTTTTLTFTANTGQTVDGNVVTAGVANIPACIVYNGTSKAWKNSN